jgi:hypothetical protein
LMRWRGARVPALLSAMPLIMAVDGTRGTGYPSDPTCTREIATTTAPR